MRTATKISVWYDSIGDPSNPGWVVTMYDGDEEIDQHIDSRWTVRRKIGPRTAARYVRESLTHTGISASREVIRAAVEDRQ